MPYKDPVQQREFNRVWIAERRRQFFQGRVCVKCGSTDELELDHIDGSIKVSHRIWSWSEEKRKAELAKCQILCNLCHKQKTAEERIRTDHGGSRMYNVFGCRCDTCRAYKKIVNAKRSTRLCPNG